MENNADAKVAFSIALIQKLKNNGFISEGIMLPLLVGAYQVKEQRVEPVDLNYIKHVFEMLLKDLYETDTYLYLKECEAFHNFVLKVSELPLKSYKPHIIYNGKPVIYCKDSNEDTIIDDSDEAINYLLDKYIAVLGKYCNFIGYTEYPHMRQLDIKKYLSPECKEQLNELDIIQSLLQ